MRGIFGYMTAASWIGCLIAVVFAVGTKVANGPATIASEAVNSSTLPMAPTATLAPPPATAADDEVATEEAPSDPDKSTMTGRVVLEGTPPAARKIQITKDPEICKAANTEIQEVVVGKNGGLANTVVEITGVDPPDGEEWTWKTPEAGYVLRQKDCGFVPSMLVMPNGANVKVFNDDPVAHNVNTGAWNEMQAKDAAAIEKPVESRSPLRVSCNIHSWMEAWIYPAQSPFFAVTDKNGKFSIKNIPPGRYRVVVWHPNLGKKRERFEFTAGETVEQDFTYEAN